MKYAIKRRGSQIRAKDGSLIPNFYRWHYDGTTNLMPSKEAMKTWPDGIYSIVQFIKGVSGSVSCAVWRVSRGLLLTKVERLK